MFLVNMWITLCLFPGLLKFCTVGFCGIGSLVDFMLISMQVRDFNFQVLAHLYLFTFPSAFFLVQVDPFLFLNFWLLVPNLIVIRVFDFIGLFSHCILLSLWAEKSI